MKYPALDVAGADADLLSAIVDDFSPTAIDDRDQNILIYFTNAADRDATHAAIRATWPNAVIARVEIDDENWARRSQENLTPITVGRITVTPPWHAQRTDGAAGRGVQDESLRNDEIVPGPHDAAADQAHDRIADRSGDGSISIVITPSMGFGTGHHVTTRLCLAALQMLPVSGARVLDVGTGSGVLAIAARLLGASNVVGIDYDADAIASAEENLEANPAAAGVSFKVVDIRDTSPAPADIVLANLTGALLVQSAGLLLDATAPGGMLILSGLLSAERDDVVGAFGNGASLHAEQSDEGWVGLVLNRTSPSAV